MSRKTWSCGRSRSGPPDGRAPRASKQRRLEPTTVVFAAGLWGLSLATGGGSLTACKTESAPRGARQWMGCTCSYISDFDEPGAAPIDVCSDGHHTEDIAATCARNDGVGVPTNCRCDPTPRGPCEKSDRCRPGKEATP